MNNMKKRIYSALIAGLSLFAMTACSDFLEVSSPSEVDSDFVFGNTTTARAALDGAYEAWRVSVQNAFFGDGLYYAVDIPGSDIERHPEAFANQLGRHYPECFYQNGTYTSQYPLLSYLKENDLYARAYEAIAKANAAATAIEESPNFEEIISGGQSEMGQMYGEAIAIRASVYRELCKYWGDVPFVNHYGNTPYGLTGRDSIYDVCIADLQRVEPLMYPVGSIPGVATSAKNYFSQTYVQGLIGRMCLDAAGYQTRRNDIERVDGEGNPLEFETMGNPNNDATYGRRTDWRDLYQIAKTYYEKLLANSGTARFYTTDPRSAESNGRSYNNPYQYFFQQMHESDITYADESIYEYAMQQGGSGNDARPYSFGRPSSGSSTNRYPQKNYGQGRINPAFYYGIFDPKDKRRDVSVTVTGSSGTGYETIIPFAPGSVSNGGGLSLNKWDENRQKTVWTANHRKSGINGPYMRMAEIYLGYAEVCAALGDELTARQYLATVRERSFPEGEAHTDQFISECGSMLRAVIEERGFEFAGEGDRRWTLIRTGFLPDAIRKIKELTNDMINGLEVNGYYQFDNGNVISNSIWSKRVDLKALVGYRLTAQAPEEQGSLSDDVYGALYPGWRGQNDSWESYGKDYAGDENTNIAIQGLFERIDDAKAAELEANGYSEQPWGSVIVDNKTEYYTYLFYDYDYVSAPIYLWPFTPNVLTTGGFTNGYGFAQQ